MTTPTERYTEAVARAIAPHLEGGREFDQMPHDRVALREWFREGMCSVNDATRDDAIAAAQAAITALLPAIEQARQEGRDSVSEDDPVAWLHTLHMEGGQTYERLLDHDGTDPDEPRRTGFGVPGRNYSEEYTVTAEPLYRRREA